MLFLEGLTVRNANVEAAKDLVVTCELRANSGTIIGFAIHTVFELVPANKTLNLGKVNMGFINPQTKSLTCEVAKATFG